MLRKILFSLIILIFSNLSYSDVCKNTFEKKEVRGEGFYGTIWVLKEDTQIRGIDFKKGTSFLEIKGFFNKLEEEIRKSVF